MTDRWQQWQIGGISAAAVANRAGVMLGLCPCGLRNALAAQAEAAAASGRLAASMDLGCCPCSRATRSLLVLKWQRQLFVQICHQQLP